MMDGLAQAWEEADPVEADGFEASPDAPTPAVPLEPADNYFDEEGFQDWYGRWSTIAGIDQNPDAPEHKYDYRSAYKVDAKPEFDEPSGEYHWPSAFKADDHPNRYIDNVDTKSGIDMQAAWDEAGAPDSAIDRKVMPDMPEGAYDRPAEKERAGDDDEYQKRLEKQLAANERAVPVIGKHSVGWLPDLIKDTDAFRDFVSGQAVDRSGLLLNKQRELLRNGKDLTRRRRISKICSWSPDTTRHRRVWQVSSRLRRRWSGSNTRPPPVPRRIPTPWAWRRQAGRRQLPRRYPAPELWSRPRQRQRRPEGRPSPPGH
jgi:hypothetical protein